MQEEMEKNLASMRVVNENVQIKNLAESNNRLLQKRKQQQLKVSNHFVDKTTTKNGWGLGGLA